VESPVALTVESPVESTVKLTVESPVKSPQRIGYVIGMLQIDARLVRGDDAARFPPLHTATADGLLAIGGDLNRARLLAAYRRGIFPWYAPGEPVLWWSPDPRCIMLPDQLTVSRSWAKSLRGDYTFTVDAAFARVIAGCAGPRRRPGDGDGHGDRDLDGDGVRGIDGDRAGGHTWITDEMARAYTDLHRAGFAHSAEVWRGGELIGGLYGVALGGVFFGESMFSRARDASKIALARLAALLDAWGFAFIDCQLASPHLLSLGAVEVPRAVFVRRLQSALKLPGKPGRWAGAERAPTVDSTADSSTVTGG